MSPAPTERGTRPVRIANCSGASGDPGHQMLRQCTRGSIDVVTGDYLSELNLALIAEGVSTGAHPGYEPTAKEGILLSLEVVAERGIRIAVNGGALNPRRLAEEVHEEVKKRGLGLRVAYVSGDNLIGQIGEIEKELTHLDAENEEVKIPEKVWLSNPEKKVVSANAYLGARGIKTALEEGADIVICGRVADASPVIGAAWWWHSWTDASFDPLAGALIGGHLIECSAYVTGCNFAGFDRYPPETFIDVGYPIAEISSDGSSVITKHPNTAGIVTAETVKSQFVYELQGNMYLNSDVTADLSSIRIEEVGKDRVSVTGIRGLPPPPTTKLALVYRDGYQVECSVNATSYAWERKYDLAEAQLRHSLEALGTLDQFTVLEFQRIGVPEHNARSQRRATNYLRVFAQAATQAPVATIGRAWVNCFMQHFHGMHWSMDSRTLMPRPFMTYYPGVVSQSVLNETVNFLDSGETISVGHPPVTAPVPKRDNYDPPATAAELSSFGPTAPRLLGDVALGRSGDKASNASLGLFPRHPSAWPWLRAFLTRERMKELMGDDWKDGKYFVERVEFEEIQAVHFVVYGGLDAGVSSSSRLDGLAKGFVDFVRSRVVDVPVSLLEAFPSGEL